MVDPDLASAIIRKWYWRGELIAANGSSRLSTLRGYYSPSAHFIAFAIPGIQEAPQWMPNGEGEIELVRLIKRYSELAIRFDSGFADPPQKPDAAAKDR